MFNVVSPYVLCKYISFATATVHNHIDQMTHSVQEMHAAYSAAVRRETGF